MHTSGHNKIIIAGTPIDSEAIVDFVWRRWRSEFTKHDVEAAFVIAVRKASEASQEVPIKNLPGWLVTVIHRQLSTWFSQNKPEPQTISLDTLTEIEANAKNHFSNIEDATLLSIVLRQAMERLTPINRAVIHLHYFEGFSVSEIASLQGISVDNAKQRLFRARVLLRKDKELMALMEAHN